jgi:hypothetical protein
MAAAAFVAFVAFVAKARVFVRNVSLAVAFRVFFATLFIFALLGTGQSINNRLDRPLVWQDPRE